MNVMTLAAKIAAQRIAKADFALQMANAHGTGRWAAEYRAESDFWQKAAQAAAFGDLSPVQSPAGNAGAGVQLVIWS